MTYAGKTAQTLNQAACLDNGTYTSATYQAWGELSDETLIIHPATQAKTFTITNLNSAAQLNENVIVTDGDTTEFKFKPAALDKKSVEISGDKFTVTLDGVNTTATTISQSKTLTNGTLSYQAAGTGEYYTATEKGVTYTAQTGGEQFTLTGIANADGVTINGKEVTVNEAAPDMTATAAYTVELNGGDFTLKFNGNTSNTEIPASLKNGKYTSAYTPAYFTGSGKTYTFTPATNQETCTITGLSDNAKLGENVSISGKTVTLSADALTTGNVTIDGDYKLELDSKVTEPATATEQNT